jgi:hypothetical protein
VTPRFVVELMKTVGRLAMPAGSQISYLRSNQLFDSSDELALEFDAMFVMVPQFLDNGWLNVDETAHLSILNSLLDNMSGPGCEHLWTWAALETEQSWIKVRDAASKVFCLR